MSFARVFSIFPDIVQRMFSVQPQALPSPTAPKQTAPVVLHRQVEDWKKSSPRPPSTRGLK